MARRDDGAYWAYVTEEQRRQARGPRRGSRVGVEARGPRRGSRVGVEEGCPARELCESSRFQGTSEASNLRVRSSGLPTAESLEVGHGTAGVFRCVAGGRHIASAIGGSRDGEPTAGGAQSAASGVRARCRSLLTGGCWYLQTCRSLARGRLHGSHRELSSR